MAKEKKQLKSVFEEQENGGKPWRYALISHDEVRLNSSFMGLVSNQVSYKQLEIDDMFTTK